MDQMVPLGQVQAMISAALASVLSQDGRITPKGVKQNTMKGSRDQNAGRAPEAEVGIPNEPSLEAEGDPAGRPLGSELTHQKEVQTTST